MKPDNQKDTKLQIITGEQMDHAFLERVIEIDRAVYEEKYVGDLGRGIARFDRNPRTFVCLFDPEQDRLAGYVNFFPCSEALYRDIRFETSVIRDDDIRPDEMDDWRVFGAPKEAEDDTDPETADYFVDISGKTYEYEVAGEDDDPEQEDEAEEDIPEGNHVYILSLALHPDYQNKEAIIALSDGLIHYLQQLESEGCHIADLLATVVSPDGKKAATNYMFRQLRHLEDGNTVMICDGRRRDKLLKHDLCF